MHRYWFKFANAKGFLQLGAGVTSADHAEAIALLERHVFHEMLKGERMPQITEVVEDVTYQMLDAAHVLPNVGLPWRQGVWFPALNVSEADRAAQRRECRRPRLMLKLTILAWWKRVDVGVLALEYLERLDRQGRQ